MSRKVYELWFRRVFGPLVEAKTLTLAIRPGDRRRPNGKGTEVGERIRVRILEYPGHEKLGIEPIFEDIIADAVITAITVKPIGEINEEDLVGAAPNCQTRQGVYYDLGLIYNQVFTEDDVVSLVRFRYIDEKEGREDEHT